MKVTEVINIFCALDAPSNSVAHDLNLDNTRIFNSETINDNRTVRIGKNPSGQPSFLIDISNDNSNEPLEPLKMLSVNLEHNHDSLFINNVKQNTQYTLINCTNDDKEIQFLFIRVVWNELKNLKEETACEQINSIVMKLFSLFSSLTKKSKTTEIGLWGELFVIANSNSPNLIDAWHEDANERFDFSLQNEHIEVKTTTSDKRCHHFTMEQLTPPTNGNIFVCSVMTIKQTQGVTIAQLRDQVLALADTADRKQKVIETISNTMGEAYSERCLKTSFNYQIAEDSIAFYNSKDIPKVSCESCKNNRVSSISFVSDLDGSHQINENDYSELSELVKYAI